MTATAVAVLFVLAGAATVSAAPLCTKIEDWATQKLSAGQVPNPLTLTLVRALEAPSCGRSLGQNGVISLNCSWAFAYRDDAALVGFAHLSALLFPCYKKLDVEDAQVNHPDSYKLLKFAGPDGATVALALKDKGALQQTFVFLRAERRPN